MSDGESIAGKPDWWLENERVKGSLNLPEYEPPQFEDGTYVHKVVEPLEDHYDISIDFVGLNTHYPDDWMIRIDHEQVDSIAHRRNEKGNTVYLKRADEFRNIIVDNMESRI